MRYLLFFLPLAVICLILATRPTLTEQAAEQPLALPAPVTDADYYDNGRPDPPSLDMRRITPERLPNKLPVQDLSQSHGEPRATLPAALVELAEKINDHAVG